MWRPPRPPLTINYDLAAATLYYQGNTQLHFGVPLVGPRRSDRWSVYGNKTIHLSVTQTQTLISTACILRTFTNFKLGQTKVI